MYTVLSPIGGVALGHVTQFVQSCQVGRTYLRTKHGRSGRSKIRVSQWSRSVFIECVCVCERMRGVCFLRVRLEKCFLTSFLFG